MRVKKEWDKGAQKSVTLSNCILIWNNSVEKLRLILFQLYRWKQFVSTVVHVHQYLHWCTWVKLTLIYNGPLENTGHLVQTGEIRFILEQLREKIKLSGEHWIWSPLTLIDGMRSCIIFFITILCIILARTLRDGQCYSYTNSKIWVLQLSEANCWILLMERNVG